MTRVLVIAAAAGALLAAPSAAQTPFAHSGFPPLVPRALRHELASSTRVRIVRIAYIAHDGMRRRAYVVVPRDYRGGRALPLVISPHGRGVKARRTVRIWGNTPAYGRFAVVCPEGQGRKLTLYSWGDPGEIADLARMPRIVHRTLPWLRVDRRRVYAFGGSMGGQETLLLIAQYPSLLAGAASFDADTNLVTRFDAFPVLKDGRGLQKLIVQEVGALPWVDPRAWQTRSPIDWARQIAFSGVPLQIWWSWKDQIVIDQNAQSGALYRAIVRLNPHAPVEQFVGYWRHTAEFWASRRLPYALSLFGLMPPFTATP